MIHPEFQDEKGRFKKGAPFIGNRNGNKNGAKKTPTREVKDALSIAEDAMPRLILAMIADAQDNSASIRDRQMCREYLCDRIYGKANQPLSNAGNVPLVAFIIGQGYQAEVQQLTQGDVRQN